MRCVLAMAALAVLAGACAHSDPALVRPGPLKGHPVGESAASPESAAEANPAPAVAQPGPYTSPPPTVQAGPPPQPGTVAQPPPYVQPAPQPSVVYQPAPSVPLGQPPPPQPIPGQAPPVRSQPQPYPQSYPQPAPMPPPVATAPAQQPPPRWETPEPPPREAPPPRAPAPREAREASEEERDDAQEWFAVQGVDSGDTLNMRTAPGPRNPVTGQIPPDATGVEGTGRRKRVGSSVWHEVRYDNAQGWVNEKFLIPDHPPRKAGRKR